MIDDKRLQGTAQATDEDLVRGAKEHYEFVSRIACAYYNFIPRVLDEWLVMKQELLTLRRQNKALIEDAERLADEIRDKLYPDNDGNIELAQHNALMQEISCSPK